MEYFLAYSSIFSPLIPLIIVGIVVKKLRQTEYKIITTLIICSFFSDVISGIFIEGNNYLILFFYGLIEFITLLLFFNFALKMKNRITQIIILVYVLYYFLNSIFIEGFFEFNTYARSVESLIMISMCLFYFYNIYTNELNIYIEKSPSFWIVIGVLFYFSGALFSFILSSDILSKSPDRFYNSWALHNLANILKNILFAIGLWKVRAVV